MTRGQPTRAVPRRILERVRVEYGGSTYRASVRGTYVYVDEAKGPLSWAWVEGDDVVVRLGAKVPELLAERVPRESWDEVLAGALIVAALAGHPRQDPPGRPIRFIWTDHVALAAEQGSLVALSHSWVQTPQAEHLKQMSGRVHVRHS
jgi:hypothetical protein